jgi:hypothetical protein
VGVSTYPEQIAQAIRERKPFTTFQLEGRKTKGGTYILTTPAACNDDNRARDLIAVTRIGEVVALWPLVNLAPVKEALA